MRAYSKFATLDEGDYFFAEIPETGLKLCQKKGSTAVIFDSTIGIKDGCLRLPIGPSHELEPEAVVVKVDILRVRSVPRSPAFMRA